MDEQENIFDEIDANLSERSNLLSKGIARQAGTGAGSSAIVENKTEDDETRPASERKPFPADEGASDALSLPFLRTVNALPYPAVVGRAFRPIRGRRQRSMAFLSSIVVIVAMLVALCVVVLLKVPGDAASPTHPVIRAADTTTGLRVCAPGATIVKLDLGAAVVGQSQPLTALFTLCSQGNGSVHWTSSWNEKQAPWLSMPHEGQMEAPQSQQLLISASPSGLVVGIYNTWVLITDTRNATLIRLNVTFSVEASQPAQSRQAPLPSSVPATLPARPQPTATPVPALRPTPAPPTPTPTPISPTRTPVPPTSTPLTPTPTIPVP
jgi:hypothetical protein